MIWFLLWYIIGLVSWIFGRKRSNIDKSDICIIPILSIVGPIALVILVFFNFVIKED